ncbi:MAG TPA: hypothetical protein PL033_07495 [Candidatus Brocadiia bacterium]|nr:hypothetical protein [Candidatus Brocadiia bacterium]
MTGRNAWISVGVALLVASGANGQDAINIGSRLELMVDDFLIERMSGDARLQLHRPERREIVFKTDAPWEGNACAYQSVFQDGGVFRMYYHGGHYRHSGAPAQTLEEHDWNLCLAESDDGIRWRRPELGLFEFKGSKSNNIVLLPESVAEVKGDPAHTSVFIDANPDCPPDEKYKITILGAEPRGLFIMKSSDGVHFSLMSRQPSITEGAFDSQNLIFWDPLRREYREYHRDFKNGIRDIKTSASGDILKFPKPEWLSYTGASGEHLYTNAVQPYFRAPQIFMGFPARYTERGWSEPVLDLPGLDERLARAKAHPRYGMSVTDACFMTSRDGATFHRWAEAFIRPGPRTRESWVYGDNYPFWGMVVTKADAEDAPDEISLYATEGYWEGPETSIRRYALRMDGFVSASATAAGGEIVTKPIIFDGGNLTLNFETSGAGGIQVEIQDAGGKPIEGYSLNDCPAILGDSIRKIVRWKDKGGDVRSLAGKPVRLRFVLKDADLYAFQFVPYAADPVVPELPGKK